MYFFIFCVLKLMKMHESTVSESQDSASMLTNDSALVTIDRSTRTSDIFLDNVESDYRRREIGSVKEVSDTEQDLPRHEWRKERGRESDARMVREEALYTVPEGFGGGRDARLRKSKKITKISCDPPLHPLGRSLVDDHGPIRRVGLKTTSNPGSSND